MRPRKEIVLAVPIRLVMAIVMMPSLIRRRHDTDAFSSSAARRSTGSHCFCACSLIFQVHRERGGC